MSLNQSNYEKYLEWEAIEFPLVLTNLEFEQADFKFGDEAMIKIWREDNLQLKGHLTGRSMDPRTVNNREFVGKGNIIRQEIVKGTDASGNMVVIRGCVFGGFQTNNYTHNENGFLIGLDLIFDTVNIIFSNPISGQPNTARIHFEWYLIEHINPHFWGTTLRSLDAFPKKSRIGIDESDEENKKFVGRAFSRDFFVLELPDLKCIIAKIPGELPTNGMEGLCLEFRDADIAKADGKLMTDLKYFLSFLLGGRLYYMGYSKIENWELAEAFADSPDIPIKGRSALPPVHYNQQYDWGNFALQANQLFPRYRELQNQLSLNHAVDRFWIANEVPVGVNLPILAGAMEIIAGDYLKMTGNDQLEYLSKADYYTLIQEDLTPLKSKLSEINGGNIILNKIMGAFRKGPNEKISLFFSLLNLETGKAEKEAINLRNKMTHSKRDYTNDDTAFDDLILTRVYQVLFNRILLKILGYSGYYIDYSMKGCPSKHIDMKVGEVDKETANL